MIFRKFRNTAPTYVKSGRKFRIDSSMPIILSFPLPPPEPAKSPRETDLQILLHFISSAHSRASQRLVGDATTTSTHALSESLERMERLLPFPNYFPDSVDQKLSSCTMTSFKIFLWFVISIVEVCNHGQVDPDFAALQDMIIHAQGTDQVCIFPWACQIRSTKGLAGTI